MMPTPFCYQTSVLKLLHNNLITHSRNLEEESPYKPDVPGSCSKSGIVRKSAREFLQTETNVRVLFMVWL